MKRRPFFVIRRDGIYYGVENKLDCQISVVVLKAILYSRFAEKIETKGVRVISAGNLL
ncbi:MAG: hypothetical protein KIG25_04350 [Eubacteriales bacterium]|nr:hypothetical protein [Eubacteriales bacterium]